MEMTSDKIEIKQIDFNDRTFKITTGSPVVDLRASIENIGLMTPPILKQTADQRLIIVSGFQRVDACRHLGWKSMDVRIIGPDENELSCLKLAVADNVFNRSLNVIEQAVIVAKFLKYDKNEIALSRELSQAGLTVNPGLIKKLLKLHGIFNELKAKIADATIPLSIGLELGDFDQDIAIAFLKVIEQLKPTLNHQKEIIRMVKEVARLNDIPITEVMHDDIFADTVNDPELDRNQKIKKIRLRLKQMRYPEISRFEENYMACLQRIHLPAAVRLLPPLDFEGNDFNMQLRFQNLDEFKAIYRELYQLQDHPDFAKILAKNFENN